jgi:predicted flap endonuclease-1-like 5' DNA nuclease/uncharacterized protein YoxC
MPVMTMSVAGLLVAVALVAALLGWLLRGRRCAREKQAVNAGWQHQIDAQQTEHDRIAAQTARLTEQINQYQASNKDQRQRASDLAAELKDVLEQREELTTKLKDYRGKLELAAAQYKKIRSKLQASDGRFDSELRKRDERIARLKGELGKWQERIPPLVERYRLRDLEAQELELELGKARERIARLEAESDSAATRIDPIADASLDALDASNDQYDDTSETDMAGFAAGVEADGDDLKRIKGIGPAIEKTLNALGIHRFSQIATINEYDIDRIAGELRGFKSRIHREDWIGQARILQHEGDPDPA